MQAGDEGKGKVVDTLAPDVEYVARAEGGANAGHTIQVGTLGFIGHLLPSGAAADKHCVLGRGVRVDVAQLLNEMDEFRQTFNFTPKVTVDAGAHLSFQWHRALEYYAEKAKGSRRAYSTMRGMCATGGTNCFRVNPRVEMLLNPDELMVWLTDFYNTFRPIFTDPVFTSESFISTCGTILTPGKMCEELCRLGEQIKPYVGDVRDLLWTAWKAGSSILFEGAQGIMLDPYWGTYGNNTQGICTFAGIAVGTGMPIEALGRKIGIVKAYQTRVGNGPHMTELGDPAVTEEQGMLPDDQRDAYLREMLVKINSGQASAQEKGRFIREVGKEKGASTGRPRRTGWLDLAWLQYAVRVNNPDELALTKLDCLSGLRELKVCTGYKNMDGVLLKPGTVPALSSGFDRLEPVYAILPGWQEDISGMTEFESLPLRAQQYIKLIEDTLCCPVNWIGTGPGREHIIVRSR